MHDYIHSTYYAGVADVRYSRLRADLPGRLDALGAHREPEDAVEELKAELADDAKARPGQITVGATLASTSHFFPALVEKAAGIKFKYVSYEGSRRA